MSILTYGQDSYQNTPLELDETREAIESARNGVDYSDEFIPEKKKKKKPKTKTQKGKEGNPKSSWDPNIPAMGVPLVAKVLVGLLAIGLLAFILYSIFGNTSKSSIGKLTYDAETEEFAKINLQDPLEEELGKGNYRLACRILYLQMLQELVKLRAILWRNEKTNWDYYTEAKKHGKVHSGNLHSITNRYDSLWYGEQEPSLEEFNHFRGLIDQLRS